MNNYIVLFVLSILFAVLYVISAALLIRERTDKKELQIKYMALKNVINRHSIKDQLEIIRSLNDSLRNWGSELEGLLVDAENWITSLEGEIVELNEKIALLEG